MSDQAAEARSAFARGMMALAETIEPMHDFLAGQITYFRSQGFTPQEALAMAAAEFVSIFGTAIPRELPEGWGE